ncbi:hypothetical protein [Parasitella parasitica]|uniref:Uncharacterized protein n=1 Tax=Parasitella parasitica TaxID=35722 RepID=A0A0B7N663_9FUNG|nr:hypothetical protein [Parasitella parasitica]
MMYSQYNKFGQLTDTSSTSNPSHLGPVMVFTVPKIRREYFGFKGYEALPISYPPQSAVMKTALKTFGYQYAVEISEWSELQQELRSVWDILAYCYGAYDYTRHDKEINLDLR